MISEMIREPEQKGRVVGRRVAEVLVDAFLEALDELLPASVVDKLIVSQVSLDALARWAVSTETESVLTRHLFLLGLTHHRSLSVGPGTSVEYLGS